MTMGMQLNIDPARGKLTHFVRRQVVHCSLLKQRSIVNLQMRRQRSRKCILLVGG